MTIRESLKKGNINDLQLITNDVCYFSKYENKKYFEKFTKLNGWLNGTWYTFKFVKRGKRNEKNKN